MEAIEPFKVPLVAQDPRPLDYLYEPDLYSYDIKLQTAIKTASATKYQTLVTSNLKYLYWSMNQQLTHHTVTGCNLTVGDLLASGTISGPEKSEYGSLTELTWGGRDKIQIEETGEERLFIQDGDSINMTGFCEGPDYIIGFGDCEGKVLPALEDNNFF
jgi:fumarylacetoacetase